jgi:hypothetical protein
LQAEMAFRDHTIFHSGLPHPACGVLKIMWPWSFKGFIKGEHLL